ncbi:hypothetical protein CLV30_12866 [Haloactinopolyspora alba]|uniref:Helix-turn-helix protein n=1 Tax=Haloactinopolyspora alba TaxID=648780 RepID=A0A2P8DF16_9ACTN|nr:helix-turn-helix transcriptional regulator [Haloactinopolyspora alba]PSK95814.1 hypothetical protein CLV30_12866 [Haloactinopolyspora alba]
MPDNALHALIRKRREALGVDGRPVPYEWVAKQAGVPVSTVHALATTELKALTEGTRSRLTAIARALDVDPGELEAAAIESMGYQVRATYTELDSDHEVLIGAYDELDDDQRRQVVEYARFLRSQRRSG